MNRTWFFMPVTITLLSRANAAALQSAPCVPPSLRRVVQEGEQLVAVLVQQPTGWANDPRLSRAGNRVARLLASVLEGLAQMETWLHHQGRAGLTPGDRRVLMADFTRLAESACCVAVLTEDLIAEFRTHEPVQAQ
jgi:hypothetical protein